jgi:hypothetical protein
MQCWSHVLPHESCHQQFFVPCLNAFLGIGEYAQIESSDNSRNAVARVIDIVHRDNQCHLLINWYFKASQTSSDCLDHHLIVLIIISVIIAKVRTLCYHAGLNG